MSLPVEHTHDSFVDRCTPGSEHTSFINLGVLPHNTYLLTVSPKPEWTYPASDFIWFCSFSVLIKDTATGSRVLTPIAFNVPHDKTIAQFGDLLQLHLDAELPGLMRDRRGWRVTTNGSGCDSTFEIEPPEGCVFAITRDERFPHNELFSVIGTEYRPNEYMPLLRTSNVRLPPLQIQLSACQRSEGILLGHWQRSVVLYAGEYDYVQQKWLWWGTDPIEIIAFDRNESLIGVTMTSIRVHNGLPVFADHHGSSPDTYYRFTYKIKQQ